MYVATEKRLMEKNTNATETTGLFIAAAEADTIYRDVYLRRRRELHYTG
jgi:hypothetical protein